MTKACAGSLKPAQVGQRIDMAHPVAIKYLERARARTRAEKHAGALARDHPRRAFPLRGWHIADPGATFRTGDFVAYAYQAGAVLDLKDSTPAWEREEAERQLADDELRCTSPATAIPSGCCWRPCRITRS